jgi:hypothetical protein
MDMAAQSEKRDRFIENTDVFTSAKFARDTWTSNGLRKRRTSHGVKCDITEYARSVDRS